MAEVPATVSAGAAVINLVLKPLKVISKHVMYPFQVSKNVRSLGTEIERLTALKLDTERKINNVRDRNGEQTAQTTLWLSKVETIEREAEDIKLKHEQLGRCLWNICPNPWTYYKVSRSAVKKQEDVMSLCKSRESIKEVIMDMMPPLKQEIPASSSRSSYLDSALAYMKNDVTSIIGIWGMGGIGKTHLLKQINNKLTRDDVFDVVVYVTCSKECSEEKVQNEIIGKLGLNKSDSIEQKQQSIFNYLKQKSFVILLDDLWNRVDLQIVGIPPLDDVADNCKRKIVLTTRSRNILGRMEAKKKIRVDRLSNDDAWSLFKEKVTEEIISSDSQIKKYAKDVVKELGGLPLALITIGRAMSDKTHHSEWEQTIKLLKKSRLDEVESDEEEGSSTNKSVFQTLKISYESLKTEDLKWCFLHCSLWPEDYNIPKRDLIELWMGLGLIDEGNIHESYNVGYTHISRLQSVCLLEKADDDYGEGYIKMHDVIRDMALWIPNHQEERKNKWIVQAGEKSDQINISHETETLSVVMNNTELITLSTTCFPSKLSTLFLWRCQCVSISQPDAFSELVVLDLKGNNLRAIPAEICKLVQLQFLNLSENYKLNSLLPEEFEALINLKYALLRDTSSCTIPKGVLSKLKALRVLDLYKTYVKWADESRSFTFTSLEEELQCLPHFQALGITIKTNMHDFQMLSQTSTVPVRNLEIRRLKGEENYLSFASVHGKSQLQNNLLELTLAGMEIKWVKFERESHEQSIYHFWRLEELYFRHMKNMKEVVWVGLDPKDVFPRLQVLYFSFCTQLTSISWIARLPCIRELQVWGCKNMKQLISIDDLNNGGLMASQHSLPFLKKIWLVANNELESISDPVITFPALEIFHVVKCNKLRKLPFKNEFKWPDVSII